MLDGPRFRNDGGVPDGVVNLGDRHHVHLAYLFGAALLFPFKALTNAEAATDVWMFVRVLVPLATLLAWRLLSPVGARHAVPYFAGAVGTVGAAMVFCCVGFAGDIGSCLANVSYIFLLICWCGLYARLSLSTAVLAVAGSYIGGAALYFMLVSIPTGLLAGTVILLPLISAGLLLMACAEHGDVRYGAASEAGLAGPALEHFPVPLAVTAAAFSFVFGINSNHASIGVDVASAGVVGAIMLILLAGLGKRASLHSVFRVMLPVMVAVLAASQVPGVLDDAAGAFVRSACYGLAEVTSILILCDLCRRFGMDPVASNSALRLVMGGAFVVGNVLDRALMTAVPGTAPLILGLLSVAVALVASTLWLLCGYAPAQPALREASAPGTGDGGGESAVKRFVEARCTLLAEEYHLSPRETEVLRLLAFGLSVPLVEEELHLSPSTVKTHVRHIYTKLGIHSRNELRSLLRLDA